MRSLRLLNRFAMRAQLIPLDGTAPIDIVKDLTLVGRREDCDLRFEHKTISKMHCIIVKTDGLLFLRDLGSTNGTRVNGQRVRRAALLPNDQLAIAGHTFGIALGPDEPAVESQDRTQQLDPKEIARLRKQPSPVSTQESDRSPMERVQPNRLPDHYAENDSKRL
jgi:pSer/pThr/pTyr-binding forkhead associated (FHA) protein